MRLPLTDANDGASIDMEKTKEMVDTFIEKGFTYFDTAWMYCGFRSEDAAKECLVDRHPRDSYTLATKLHASFISNGLLQLAGGKEETGSCQTYRFLLP